MGDADALEQAEQVVGGFELHLVEHLVVGELGDADDDLAGQRAEPVGQPVEGGDGQHLDVRQRGGFQVLPRRCGDVGAGHGSGRDIGVVEVDAEEDHEGQRCMPQMGQLEGLLGKYQRRQHE